MWLKFYVFERTPKAYMPTLVTFMVSAFWHGFYEMYYCFFFFAFFITEAGRVVYRRREFFTWMPSLPKQIICK